MSNDLIRDEIAFLLTKPARYADLMGDGCDAMQQVEGRVFAQLFAAHKVEYGARIDELRDELARILTGYPRAVELAQRSLDARDEYAHRAGRAA